MSTSTPTLAPVSTPPKVRYICYLLYSPSANRTYVGYTNNIIRRIRQHKGELADKTKRTRWGKPWDVVGYVSGFPTSRAALQFERAWHVCKKVGRAPKKQKSDTVPAPTGVRGPWGIEGRIRALEYLLETEKVSKLAPFTASLNLRMNWVDPTRKFEREHQNCRERLSTIFERKACQINEVGVAKMHQLAEKRAIRKLAPKSSVRITKVKKRKVTKPKSSLKATTAKKSTLKKSSVPKSSETSVNVKSASSNSTGLLNNSKVKKQSI